MGRKPKLKPAPGWDYRMIICDAEGNVVYDDTRGKDSLRFLFEVLYEQLKEKR